MTGHICDHSTNPTSNDTTQDTISTTSIATAAVVNRVEAALTALAIQYRALVEVRPITDQARAQRCAAIALNSARQAGWWRLLIVYHDRHGGLHPLFYRAALSAYVRERSDARFWRDSAADWQARAEKVPTSDAAGALSNWAELGVTA